MIEERRLHSDRIIRDPDILGGKPVVSGTRISVEVILEYLAHNPDFEDLFADYPRLTLDDVKACPGYAQAVMTANRGATGTVGSTAKWGSCSMRAGSAVSPGGACRATLRAHTSGTPSRRAAARIRSSSVANGSPSRAARSR